MDGWSEGMYMEEWERANKCMFGCNCRDQLNCASLYSPEGRQLSKDERELRVRELKMRCGFCVRGRGGVAMGLVVLVRDASPPSSSGSL